jgi:hypothetical protein
VQHYVTTSIQQSRSWDATRSSAIQGRHHISCSLKFHYHVHKNTPHISIWSHINSVHALPSFFFIIHFQSTLPSVPIFSKWYFTFRFSSYTLYEFLFSPTCTTCPIYFILVDYITTILVSEEQNHEASYYTVNNSLL